jgi:voltage-gated potassium channel
VERDPGTPDFAGTGKGRRRLIPLPSGSVKNRVWELLERPAPGDHWSRLFDYVLIMLVLLSVTGVTLSTVPSIAARYPLLLRVIETGTVTVFAVEVLLRLWVADLKYGGRASYPHLAYLRSTEGVIDLTAVIPFYLQLLVAEPSSVLGILCTLRVLKLVRYSPALATLSTVIVQERHALVGTVTTILMLLLFSSSVIYAVERTYQPEAFGSIPASMWWGISTLTTVGYGDVTPVTPLGRFFGGIVAILGVGMFALPAGVLSSGFIKEMKQRRFLRTAELVASVPLFEGLTPPEVAQISRQLEPLVVQAGQVVVRKGQPANSMFFVADGGLEVEIDGHRKRLTTDFFGEIALLHGGIRSATIRTKTRCQLLVLHASHFEELLATSPRIASAVQEVARQRLQADDKRGRRP